MARVTVDNLLKELELNPGRICLASSEEVDQDFIARLADQAGGDVISVGRRLTESRSLDLGEVERRLSQSRFLVDLDVLMWPSLGIEPVGLLRRLSRSCPVISLWPGSIKGAEATYSEPGRVDFYQSRLSGAAIISSVPDGDEIGIRRIP